MIRRKSSRALERFDISFAYPNYLRNVAVHLEMTRNEVRSREYVVAMRGFLDSCEEAFAPGGWNYSTNLKAKFCYVPELSAAGMVKLPPLKIDRVVTRIRIEVHEWVGTRAPVAETVASAWIVVPNPEGGSMIMKAARKGTNDGA